MATDMAIAGVPQLSNTMRADGHPEGTVARVDNNWFTKEEALAWLAAEEKRFLQRSRHPLEDDDAGVVWGARAMAQACARVKKALPLALGRLKGGMILDLRTELAVARTKIDESDGIEDLETED
jgi:hypothetical protein